MRGKGSGVVGLTNEPVSSGESSGEGVCDGDEEIRFVQMNRCALPGGLVGRGVVVAILNRCGVSGEPIDGGFLMTAIVEQEIFSSSAWMVAKDCLESGIRP